MQGQSIKYLVELHVSVKKYVTTQIKKDPNLRDNEHNPQLQRKIDIDFMRQALTQAELAASWGETPIGALCVKDGRIISYAHNERETTKDPTAHAEVLAIRRAASILGNWRLNECDLYVTLEPCLMCSGTILNSRIKRVIFGPYDPKAGALGSLYNVGSDPRLNHETEVVGGILEEISSNLLTQFFQNLRCR